MLHFIAPLDALLISSYSTRLLYSHQCLASDDESSHVSTNTNLPSSLPSSSPSSVTKQEYQEEYYRSVSDYMGGWHAGKYDFDTRISGVTALNYEKSVVFDDGSQTHSKSRNNIRGGARGKVAVAELDDDLQKNRPKWSSRKLSWKTDGRGGMDYCNANVNLQLKKNMVEAHMVVQNEERTWEPFFATIEISSIEMDNVVVTGKVMEESWAVEPSCGTLAPRGGVDLYTDRIIFLLKDLSLSIRKNEVQPHLQSPSSTSSAYLVVRTEQDYWAWKISE